MNSSILKQTTPHVSPPKPIPIPETYNEDGGDMDVNPTILSPTSTSTPPIPPQPVIQPQPQLQPRPQPTNRSPSIVLGPRIQFDLESNTVKEFVDDGDGNDSEDNDNNSEDHEYDVDDEDHDYDSDNKDHGDDGGGDYDLDDEDHGDDYDSDDKDHGDDGGGDYDSDDEDHGDDGGGDGDNGGGVVSTDVVNSNTKQVVSWIEQSVLYYYRNQLSFPVYIITYYKHYMTWVQMVLGLSEIWMDRFRFCLARSINMMGSYNPMGIDIEVLFILHDLEKAFHPHPIMHYRDVVIETLKTKLELDPALIEHYLHIYRPQQPLRLTVSEFFHRLSNVPLDLLNAHSQKTWRSPSPDTLNQTPYVITYNDLENGKPLAPPANQHIGIHVWKLLGMLHFIPEIEKQIQVQKPRPHAVTFF